MTTSGTLLHSFGQQDATECVAVQTETDGAPPPPGTVLYGVPGLNGPPNKSSLSPEPQECYYQEGGKGNTQACHFYIQNTFP